MVNLSEACANSLLARWCGQIGAQRRRRAARGARSLAVLSYLRHAPGAAALVDIRHLVWVVLYDQQRASREPAIRVAGYGVAAVAWGVAFGGAEYHRFEKRLHLAPTSRLGRREFNLAQPDLLALALGLDRCLEHHAADRHLPVSRGPRLPRLWAALSVADARRVCPAGPEFEARRASRARPVPARMAGNQVLVPLEFVSHAWQHFVAVYADLRSIPKRQVFHLRAPERDLVGFAGAAQFDFYSSRFSNPTQRSPAAHAAR